MIEQVNEHLASIRIRVRFTRYAQKDFKVYSKGQQAEIMVLPFDVWPTGDIHDAYVQPDVTVVCDLAKLTAVGCVGAPDLVVEVLSPTTAGKDRKAKWR